MKEIDWSKLSFGYMKTDYNVRCYYRDGKWGELELCSEDAVHRGDLALFRRMGGRPVRLGGGVPRTVPVGGAPFAPSHPGRRLPREEQGVRPEHAGLLHQL